MSSSNESMVLPILVGSFLRTIYGYVLVAVVALLFPLVGLSDYAAAWYWLLIPAVVLTGLWALSAYNEPRKMEKLREQRSPEGRIQLDAARQAYLTDALKRREIINERVAQVQGHASLSGEIATTVEALDRLIPDLETLLKRNLRLAADIHRLESGGAARPSQESVAELKGLYDRQWDVIRKVTSEIATIDANVAVVINQVDSGEDAKALETSAKEWSTKLGYWKDGIREVYGTEPQAS
jgi:hypothetical protein